MIAERSVNGNEPAGNGFGVERIGPRRVRSVCLWVGCWFLVQGVQAAVKTIPLPEPRRIGPMSVEQAMAERRSVRNFAETPLTLEQVSQLLWSAQGVSYAPNRRTAPSAGATYPLMVWLVVNRVTGLESGVYRFHQQDHCLELHKPGSVVTRWSDSA